VFTEGSPVAGWPSLISAISFITALTPIMQLCIIPIMQLLECSLSNVWELVEVDRTHSTENSQPLLILWINPLEKICNRSIYFFF
jgi:hypothetical protein